MASLSDLRSLFDALDQPSLLVEKSRIRLANAAARELLGREIEGSDVRLAIRHPIALEQIVKSRSGDVEITGIGRPEQPWLISVRPISGSAALVQLHDRSTARASERMRVDFVANASHELRTPLAAILGYAETIAEDGGLSPEEHARFGRVIQSEAARMLRIVNDLMSLSRIEADRFLAPRGQVRIDQIVERAIQSARLTAEQRRCRLTVEIERDLPAIPGDEPQLAQLLDNLIANALRYGCGRPDSELTVSARLDGDWVELSVADNGEGIPKEHLPRLTERFYRVDDARSRDSGGTGLGLAIVKHIVERHRGQLTLLSEVGQGTEALIRLPVR